MIEAYDPMQIVPPFLREDRDCNAIAHAIAAAMEDLTQNVNNALGEMWTPEAMPPWHKDELLRSLNLTPAGEMTEGEKVALLKNAYPIAKLTGTETGINLLLTKVYGADPTAIIVKNVAEGQLKGWFFVTDEPVSEGNDLYRIAVNAESRMPAYFKAVAIPGESLSVWFALSATSGGLTVNARPAVSEKLKNLLYDAIQLAKGSTTLKLEYDGAAHELTAFDPASTTLQEPWQNDYSASSRLSLYNLPEGYAEAEGYVTKATADTASGEHYERETDGVLSKSLTLPLYAMRWNVYEKKDRVPGSLNAYNMDTESIAKRMLGKANRLKMIVCMESGKVTEGRFVGGSTEGSKTKMNFDLVNGMVKHGTDYENLIGYRKETDGILVTNTTGAKQFITNTNMISVVKGTLVTVENGFSMRVSYYGMDGAFNRNLSSLASGVLDKPFAVQEDGFICYTVTKVDDNGTPLQTNVDDINKYAQAVCISYPYGNAVSYQWQFSRNGIIWLNINNRTREFQTLQMSTANNQMYYRYRCVITGINDRIAYTKYVKPKLLLESPIRVTRQPEDVLTQEGNTIEIHCEADGNGLTYQWQYSNSESWINSNLNGYNTPTLRFTATSARTNFMWACLITDVDGNELRTESAIIKFAEDEPENSDAIVIVEQPQAPVLTKPETFTMTTIARENVLEGERVEKISVLDAHGNEVVSIDPENGIIGTITKDRPVLTLKMEVGV